MSVTFFAPNCLKAAQNAHKGNNASDATVRIDVVIEYVIVVRPLNSVQAGGCRYIWDGWSDIEEREFVAGTALSNGASLLDRIFVNGKDIDEPILCAIDGDKDRFLTTSKNTTNGAGLVDAEYYFLSNRMGSIAALLDADPATNGSRVLEYYRYSIYGEATVLPVVDTSPANGFEDTPLSLTDNNAKMIDERNGANNILGDSDDVKTAGRISKFKNRVMYTARELDEKTGLYYYRYRYYEARMGRFVGRDPVKSPWRNLYHAFRGKCTSWVDPFGLEAKGKKGAQKKEPEVMDWRDVPAIEPQHGEEKKLIRYAYDSTPDGRNSEIYKNFVLSFLAEAQTIPVTSFTELINKLRDIPVCECVQKLVLGFHGATSTTSMPGDANKDGVVDKDEEIRQSHGGISVHGWSQEVVGPESAKAFGGKIKNVMCKSGCEIHIRSCYGAEGDTAVELSRATGCTVLATMGCHHFQYYEEKSEGRWWAKGGVRKVTAKSDGSVQDAVEDGHGGPFKEGGDAPTGTGMWN